MAWPIKLLYVQYGTLAQKRARGCLALLRCSLGHSFLLLAKCAVQVLERESCQQFAWFPGSSTRLLQKQPCNIWARKRTQIVTVYHHHDCVFIRCSSQSGRRPHERICGTGRFVCGEVSFSLHLHTTCCRCEKVVSWLVPLCATQR